MKSRYRPAATEPRKMEQRFSILTRSISLYLLIIRGRKLRQNRKESVIVRREQIDLAPSRRQGLLRLLRSTIDVVHARVPRLLQVHYQALLGRHVTRVRSRVGETLAAVVALEWLFTAMDAEVFLCE